MQKRELASGDAVPLEVGDTDQIAGLNLSMKTPPLCRSAA